MAARTDEIALSAPLSGAVLSLLASALSLPACSEEADRGDPSPPAAPLFREATAESGLDRVPASASGPSFYLPEIMGSGCALLDYDDDGDLDLYLVRRGGPPGAPAEPDASRDRLLRRDAGDLFVDVTEEAGLGNPGYGMGVAAGDFDDDGRPDLYVTNFGPNVLYRNLGDGRFEDVTAAAGVGDPRWGTSAAFFDADGDGRLDLFVVNYIALDPARRCFDAVGRPDYCGPREFPGSPDVLYLNRGDGTFEDASSASGIGAAALRGLGVAAADLDGDARLEIVVANDNHPNQLWVRREDGRFVDEAAERGAAFNRNGEIEASMGIVAEDLDADGDLDLFVTNLRGESHTLWRNDGAGFFEDATAEAGLLAPSLRFTGFGAVALDLENDGDLDLAVANGHVFRSPVEPGASPDDPWREYLQPGSLLSNDGAGRFSDDSARAGPFGSRPQLGRGLLALDLDGDGGVDLVSTDGRGRASAFRNEVPARGAWLQVRALAAEGRGSVPGAQVTVVAGGRRRLRPVPAGESYLCSMDGALHFGLGSATAVDEIAVRWPDGTTERFPGGPVNRLTTVVRGHGR